MIDVVGHEEDIYEQLENIKKQRVNSSFTLNDLVLIHSTNHFPYEGVIKPVADVPILTKPSNYLSNIMINRLKVKMENEGVNLFSDEGMEYFSSVSNELKPYSSQYRSTVHFCINGLVSTHDPMKGNFDNRNYIIVIPLKDVLESQIISLRAEDTFIQGQVPLTFDSYILVPNEVYNTNIALNNNDHIIPYNGDSKTALTSFLLSKGYVSLAISTYGYEESSTSDKIEQVIDSISKQKNISRDPHRFSGTYRSDDEKSLIIWDMYTNLFEDYLRQAFDNDTLTKEDLIGIINNIEIATYKMIVNDFNQKIEQKVIDGKWPTNNELLDGATLSFDYDKGIEI